MILNQQPIEKRTSRTDGAVEVHSTFHTIQGEGPFCGVPCVFIRLAGCNLQCPGCDTEYSSQRLTLDPETLLVIVREYRPAPGLVVITGGEPFRQDLSALLRCLTRAGYYVQIETNGTLPPSDFNYSIYPSDKLGAYVVCSPKSGKVHPDIWDVACCAKYVLEADSMREEDGLPLRALMHSANPYVARPPKNWGRPIYLQPMDAKHVIENSRNIAAARDSCMKHGYVMQLQIHKLIGVE